MGVSWLDSMEVGGFVRVKERLRVELKEEEGDCMVKYMESWLLYMEVDKCTCLM